MLRLKKIDEQLRIINMRAERLQRNYEIARFCLYAVIGCIIGALFIMVY